MTTAEGPAAARAAVDAALRAHRLAPAQREWAVAYAAANPELFRGANTALPDYLKDRVNALIDIYFGRLEFEEDRGHGKHVELVRRWIRHGRLRGQPFRRSLMAQERELARLRRHEPERRRRR